MKKKRILASLLMVGLLSGVFMGCDESNDDKQVQQTEQLQKQASAKLGMPNIVNFYEKQTLKTIMEQCDDSNLITYTYIKNDMTGKFTFLGQSIGYGIPYGTEYTNPQRYEMNGATLPQADPNGLYKAENVSATWVMLIDPQSKQAKPVYVESDITVSQFKLPKNLCDASTLPSDY
jgi:hypothetical protein